MGSRPPLNLIPWHTGLVCYGIRKEAKMWCEAELGTQGRGLTGYMARKSLSQVSKHAVGCTVRSEHSPANHTP